MRECEIAVLSIIVGFLLMFSFGPGFDGNQDPGNTINSDSSIGQGHPVDEKFGGGVKIADYDDGNEVDLGPLGPGNN